LLIEPGGVDKSVQVEMLAELLEDASHGIIAAGTAISRDNVGQ
jgi:hypothetical protein